VNSKSFMGCMHMLECTRERLDSACQSQLSILAIGKALVSRMHAECTRDRLASACQSQYFIFYPCVWLKKHIVSGIAC
jgi:hypothetical protein